VEGVVGEVTGGGREAGLAVFVESLQHREHAIPLFVESLLYAVPLLVIHHQVLGVAYGCPDLARQLGRHVRYLMHGPRVGDCLLQYLLLGGSRSLEIAVQAHVSTAKLFCHKKPLRFGCRFIGTP
jgi:hypothetical protein